VSIRRSAQVGFLLLLGGACGGDELPPECSSPDEGDLEGYCILGDNDGRTAAMGDIVACVDEEELSAPEEVAEGPGSCGDEVSEAVLEAEQQAYVDCWQLAYDDTYEEPTLLECAR